MARACDIPNPSSEPDTLAQQIANAEAWMQQERTRLLTPDPVWGTCPADRVHCVGQSAWLSWMALSREQRQQIADGICPKCQMTLRGNPACCSLL